METNLYYNLKGITSEEFSFVQNITSGMTDHQSHRFFLLYAGKRQSAEEILLFTLLGFVGAAGVHRLITGQILLGTLYFLTAGLFFIGTIVDAINYRKLTLNYNQKLALECAGMVSQAGR